MATRTRRFSLPPLDQSILDRYKQVVLLNRQPMQWSKQTENMYREDRRFPRINAWLADAALMGMLQHRYWLGCVAPPNRMVDRITLDIDAKTIDGVAARDERYAAIREVFGPARRPLVYGTPSGYGLRVCYRIPVTTLSEIATHFTTGLVPDVLRGHGLAVEDGTVEVYPQTGRPDRLPLGRRMPVLDADTLLPLDHANIGDSFDLDALLGALGEMEQWHGAPLTDLLDHLRALDRVEAPATMPPAPRTVATATTRTASSIDAAAALADMASLIENGLPGANTRRKAEWQVGLEFVRNPTHYKLPASPQANEIAEALAVWLSYKHNGYSDKWNAALTRYKGDENAAVDAFVAMYMRADKRGLTFPDRLSLAAESDDPSMQRRPEVSDLEARAILGLAARHYEPGALRYRFECWLFEWMRWVKRLILQARREGTTTTSVVLVKGRAVPAVIVEIPADKLRNDFPYGSGETGEGEARYHEFVRILDAEGIMRIHKAYRTKGLTGADRGYATRYAVPLHVANLSVRQRDLDASPEAVWGIVSQMRAEGNTAITMGEVYHALHAARTMPTRAALVARYKRDTADYTLRPLIERISADLEAPTIRDDG